MTGKKNEVKRRGKRRGSKKKRSGGERPFATEKR
jgi:hypothetical protein